MNVRLPCGANQVPVDIPDNWINGRCYRSFRLEAVENMRAAVISAMEDAVGVRSVADVLRGRKDIAIALDSSQPALFDNLLPAFLDKISQISGLPADRITLVVTNTSFQGLTDAHLELILPAEIRSSYPVILHDPFDGSSCYDFGALSSGVPLAVNKDFVNADLKILFGPVIAHLVQGFAGGRSILLPGLAHESTVRALFSHEHLDDPHVNYGNLAQNPVHAAGVEAVQAVGVELSLCAPVNPEGKPSMVFFGEANQAFLSAAAALREKMTVSLKEPMDIVVTNGGGAPHDATLKDLVNALSAALPILKPGGTIVATANLSAGVGHATLEHLLETSASPAAFDAQYKGKPAVYPGQWIAQRYLQLLREHEVIVYSDGMDENRLWELGLTPTTDLQEAILVAMQGHGQKCKIAALPDGPFSLATVAT